MTSSNLLSLLPVEVLDRWIAGEPTPDDRARLAAFTDAHPGARALLEALGGSEHVEPDLAQMRQQIQRTIDAHAATQSDAPRAARRRWPVLSGALIGVAAVAGAIALALIATRRAEPTVGPTRRYATQSGQRATVELADGSRITIAPRSMLTLTSDAHGHPYAATLVGEAHFDIVPNRSAPFSVRTGGVVTRVLGTTFDVRRYADEIVGRVVVLSGKVSVDGRGVSRTVAANMMSTFTDSSVTTSVVTDPAQYTDWTHGSLVFHDTPVPVVLATLKRWYGYEFRLRDSTLSSEVVTTVFPLGETQEMMQRLRRLLGVTMTFDDSVITLRPAQGASRDWQTKQDKSPTPLTTPKEVGR